MPLYLDSEVAAALAALSTGHKPLPPPAVGDVMTRRATVGEGIRALAGPMPDGVIAIDYYAAASDGHQILLRCYQPQTDKTSPCQSQVGLVYYIHGAGMILCSVDIGNSIVARYAVLTGVPFLIVDCRRAPEHPYPTTVDDWHAHPVNTYSMLDDRTVQADEYLEDVVG
jgi:acetyl esterase/lipase